MTSHIKNVFAVLKKNALQYRYWLKYDGSAVGLSLVAAYGQNMVG